MFVRLLGDFDVILDDKHDQLVGNIVITRSRNVFKELIRGENSIDCWRVKNLTKRTFTWSQKNTAIRCRLDYLLLKNNTCNEIKSVR